MSTLSLVIFKPGCHLSMNGSQFCFSASDLVTTAKAYNAKLSQAPLVLGHPEHDAPAHGWVTALYSDGETLKADIESLSPEMVSHITSGRYRKRSPSFYPPGHQANPVPGVYYLKHVGFLGAAAPAVKGMPDPRLAFSEFEQQPCQPCNLRPAPGYVFDPERLALHKQAKRLMEYAPGMSYIDAVMTVERSQQPS